MSQGAHVSSLEALESFRASLIVYSSKARPTLEEISADIMRTRLWLQNDKRLYWENQVRRRAQILEEAKKELFNAKLSNFQNATAAEMMAVRRAERALEEAETKLSIVKRWSREFDSRVEPLARQLEKLQSIVSTDLPRATAYLSQAVKTLDAYATLTAPSVSDSSSPIPADAPPAETPESGEPQT